MKIEVSVATNLQVEEVTKKTREAARLAMRDLVVDVTGDAVKMSPWLTGNNRRSIAGEVSGMGSVASGGEGGAERIVDDNKTEGAVYSTSGYGGYLEVGTFKMAPRPYFRPAFDKNIGKYAGYVKKYLEE